MMHDVFFYSTAPGDYIFIMTTIVFPAGSMSQEVSVQTVGDTIHERLENFTAILSNPVGGGLGSGRIATVIIADDDGELRLCFMLTYSGNSNIPALVSFVNILL